MASAGEMAFATGKVFVLVKELVFAKEGEM